MMEESSNENIAAGEEWECVCGKIVSDSFKCEACGLTVIGSDMEKVRREQEDDN